MAKRKIDVLVVGELNVDLILNRIDSFPEMGKEKLAQDMSLTLGSSSAIFASNLSSLGAKVSFLGKIGDDVFGDLIMSSLKRKNVGTNFIIKDKKANSGATIVLNYNENRAMVTYQGAMNELKIKDITLEHIQSAKHLHFSSLYLQPGIKKDIKKLFKMAKAAGLTTSLDMQWDPNEKWDLDYKHVLPYVDVFLPNDAELLNLTKADSIDEGLKVLAPYANQVVVKMGSQGSTYFSKDKKVFVASFLNKKVVDAIGAGDSFNSGYIFKFIQGREPEECQVFGNLMGAINTTAAGGTTAFTNYDDIMKTARKRFGVKVV